jgi:hypothetical protein
MTALLVAAGLVTTLRPATNPSTLPGGLAVVTNAESTALYCTGLVATAHRPGRVTFFNTAAKARSLALSVVSNDGHSYTSTLELAAHASQSIQPSVLDQGDDFAVAVQVSGGGVVGEEVAGSDRAEAPCVTEGVTSWFASGFETQVGSSAEVSVYNPTATAAVFNTSIYTGTGFSAPQSFQGVSVPAHAEVELDLGTQVVSTSDIGVGIRVLRGALVFTGVQVVHGTLSFDQGSTSASRDSWFPDVTTAAAATATLDVANPGSRPATVSVAVALGEYKVPEQTLTVAPFSTGTLSITPNSAIPAAGYADLALRSSAPVVADLATGTGDWFALVAPVPPGEDFLVHNFTGLGFDAATVTNTSGRAVAISVSDVEGASTTTTTTRRIVLGAHVTKGLSAWLATVRTSSGDAYFVRTASPSLVLGLTLPSHPAGVNPVAPLDGR